MRRPLDDDTVKKDSSVPSIPIQRGDVVLVDLRGAEGREKRGERPCLIVQNDKGNGASPLTIIVPLTNVAQYKRLPIQVLLAARELGPLAKDSVAECGHIRSVDRDTRIKRRLGRIDDESMGRIDKALRISLALT